MRIGFVLDDSLDKPDGVQQYITALGRWFSSQGHEVHYLAGDSQRQDLQNVHSLAGTIGIKFNGNRVGTPLPASKSKIRGLLAAYDFDVLHVQMPHSPLLAGRVVDASGERTVRFGTFHILPYTFIEKWGARLLGRVQRRQLQTFDKTYSVSEPARAFANKAFGLSAAVMPNVVDVASFASAKPLPIYKGKLTIVFLGRLVERKGCMQLLEAVDFLKQSKPGLNFQVVIAGKGPQAERLKSFVSRNKLDTHVDFIGFVPEHDKPRLLKSADITVFPSLGGESFGIVLLEAMASGSSVVLAGDNSGYRSVMGARDGQMFDPRDISELSGMLAKFIENKEARLQAIAWQNEHVKRFDVRNVGTQILADYRKALKTKRSMR